MQDILLVSFGAVLGANTRFIAYKELKKLNLSKEYIVLIINTFSAFCLGFFLSFFEQISSLDFSYKLLLFFSIGFLGSLSTFSTFVYDLFELILRCKFFRAFKLLIFSITLGIIALTFGFLLVN